MLEHKGIAGTEGRAGKRGSHLGTAKNPTPNGRPQRRGKDAPQGRMARSLTQREDWTRDLGGCLTAWWQLNRHFRLDRTTRAPSPGSTSGASSSSGASRRPHWRRGHWHTVLHGEKRQSRRMQWFQPVYVGLG